MSRAIPRILVAHIEPDEVRPIIERRFPEAPVCYVDDPSAVASALAEHDPQVAFTIKQGGFEGSFHRAILEHPGLSWFHVGGSGYEHIQPWGPERPTITNSAGVLASYLAETVLGGMLAGAFLGIFFVPLFFVLIQRLFGRRKQPTQADERSSV